MTGPGTFASEKKWAGEIALLCICALFAAALLPSLGRLDFFDGVEHFNLVTVQEMRRNEAAGRPVNWLLPTLEGEARVVKPPLTAWLTAALVSQADVAAISTADDAARDRAIRHFVFLARLPTLLCSCLMLAGVFVLGRALAGGDWRVGATAALACGGSVLFFQQGRRATTDLQLALWVTWTNAFLAMAIFQKRIWVGYIGAGIALGLASMAKGPHIALLMTVVPVGCCVLLGRFVLGRRVPAEDAADGVDDQNPGQASPLPSPPPGYRERGPGLPLLLGVAIALIVGPWWYGYVAVAVPGIGNIWWHELTRKDAQIGRNVMTPDPWYAYAAFFGLMLPWTGWMLLGAIQVVRSARSSQLNHRGGAMGLALLWLLVPVLVMSFFGEKKERYLLPFVAPAAVLAAWALVNWWDRHRPGASGDSSSATAPDGSAADVRIDRLLGVAAGIFTFCAAGWLALSVLIAGVLGGKGYRTVEDRPWFTTSTAIAIGGAALLILLLGAIRSRKNLLAPLLAVTVVAWLGGELKLRGWAASPGDNDDRPQRALASEIWQNWPDATVYSSDPVTLYGQLNRPAVVLSMQLNRVIETRPPELPRSAGEKPLVLLTDGTSAPPPIPTGWRRITVIPLRKGNRYVDILTH